MPLACVAGPLPGLVPWTVAGLREEIPLKPLESCSLSPCPHGQVRPAQMHGWGWRQTPALEGKGRADRAEGRACREGWGWGRARHQPAHCAQRLPLPCRLPPPSLCLPCLLRTTAGRAWITSPTPLSACPSSQGKLAAHLRAGMDRRFLREAPTAALGWVSPCSFPLGGGIPTSFQNFAEFYSNTS